MTKPQAKQLNDYMVNVVKKQGRVPRRFKTKILRRALDEFLSNHGTDYDIDWDKQNGE